MTLKENIRAVLDCGNSINNYRKLSNKEMIDFLVKQFDISRTSAKDMLHVMMSVKREDNFKKLFNKCRKEAQYENNKET